MQLFNGGLAYTRGATRVGGTVQVALALFHELVAAVDRPVLARRNERTTTISPARAALG